MLEGWMTRRQRTIFQLIADGRCPKQVAGDLAIAKRTVDRHLSLGKKQLKAPSTGAAVATLLRRGEIK